MDHHPFFDLQDPHIHAINAVGAAIFVGSVWSNMPTLAWYTAAIGAVFYTLLAVQKLAEVIGQVIRWWKRKPND